jgi:hypothetical protein
MTLLTPPGFLQGGTYTALLDRIHINTVPTIREFALLHRARQGFYPSKAPTFTNPSGMNVAIGACAGVIANTFATDAGDYRVSNPTSFQVTLAASSPTQNRYDIIGIQVKDNFYDASGLNSVIPAVIQGANSAGTPSDPALPLSFIPVCRAVVNATVTSPTLQGIVVYTAMEGGVVPITNQAERAAIGTPNAGMGIWRLDRSWEERWDGSAWRVQGVGVCAHVADRDSAITNPYTGQFATTLDTGKMWQRFGGVWREFPAAPRAELRATVLQTIGSGVFTSVLFGTEDKDTYNAHSTVTNTSRYTLPLDGDYLFMGAGCFASSDGFKAARWAKNGTSVPGSQEDINTTSGAEWPIPARSKIISGVVGDYVELQLFQGTGGNLNTGVTGDVQPSMSVTYLGN